MPVVTDVTDIGRRPVYLRAGYDAKGGRMRGGQVFQRCIAWAWFLLLAGLSVGIAVVFVIGALEGAPMG
ncbi:MAG: hypothetical protein ACLQBB_07460 [Solirubrobacteraceae bacterium]